MKTCPECKTEYPGGEQFCPIDGSRNISASQVEVAAQTGDPLIGAVLAGRYRVIRVLGEGGMGVVYEAEHTVIEKRVALKVLRPDFSSRQDVVERFRQEAKSASRIGHENIIDISDFGETPDGASFFVMEMLAGQDLSHAIDESKVIPMGRAIPILLQCCKALGAAHAKGIVHRDMKPENIFLTAREGNPEFVKIVDFGIAKMSDLDHPGSGGKKLTKTGMIFGTPEYMSPEQAAGKPPDHRVDVYAMGVIAFEMFAGRVPFVGDTFMAILTQHVTAQPPAIRDVNPASDVTDALEAVIRRAMSKDPRDRQSSMAELAEQIVAAFDGSVPGMIYPTGLLHPPERMPTHVPNVGTQAPSETRGIARTQAIVDTRPAPIAAPAASTMPGSDTSPGPASGSRGVMIGVAVVALLAASGAAAYFGFFRTPAEVEPVDAGVSIARGAADASTLTTGSDDTRVVEEDASLEMIAIDAGVAEDAAPAMDAAPSTDNVQIAITSTPSGAEVRVAGRGVVCARTPCFFETARGQTIALSLSSRRLEAEESLTPNANAAMHIRLRRRIESEPTDTVRPRRDGGARPAARDAGRRIRPGCVPGLHCPDFGD